MEQRESQNQSVTSEIGKISIFPIENILPTWSAAKAFNRVPVVAPAGIGLWAGSTQRPLLGVVGLGIEQKTGWLTLERGTK